MVPGRMTHVRWSRSLRQPLRFAYIPTPKVPVCDVCDVTRDHVLAWQQHQRASMASTERPSWPVLGPYPERGSPFPNGQGDPTVPEVTQQDGEGFEVPLGEPSWWGPSVVESPLHPSSSYKKTRWSLLRHECQLPGACWSKMRRNC